MDGGRPDPDDPDASGSTGVGVREPPRPIDALAIARALTVDRVAGEVVRALSDAGVRTILLKGPSLLWLYDDRPPRTYIDCDLLVAPADVGRAEAVLADLGFRHPPLDDLPDDKPWHAHAWLRAGPSVDLHRTLIGAQVPPEELWDALSARTERMRVADVDVDVLDVTGRAMHVALHAAQDGRRLGHPLVDLERALEKLPEETWREAARLARRLGAAEAFAAGLRLDRRGAGVAERLGLPSATSVDVILRSSAAPPVAVGLDWLVRTSGWRRKMRLVFHKLFPTREFMRAWSRLASRGPAGLVAAYLWRPLWLLGKTGPALRAWRRARKEATHRSDLASGPPATTAGAGLFVLLVGPDGSGKSTVADHLLERCAPMFRGTLRFHWRPGFLPRPGAVLGRAARAADRPHDTPLRGRVASLLLLAYHWFDFFLGGWFRIRAARTRGGLVVVERGWWDIAVDPRRYRLDVPATLVRALGTFLPRPDLAIVLDASPSVLLGRKQEIGEEELRRQGAAWAHALPADVRRVHVDATMSAEEVGRRAHAEVERSLEARMTRMAGAGWAALPRRGAVRWLVPRGPRRSALGGLSIYHPIAPRGRAWWESARLAAAIGGFRLLPRAQEPPAGVRRALAPYLPAGGSIAVAMWQRPGRHAALILNARGEAHGIAKVATTQEEAVRLEREAARIDSLGRLLPPPILAPRILARDERALLLEAVPWHPRLRSWRLDAHVARALGRFFRAGSDREAPTGPAHGDCTPWNLLRTRDGWVLIDWEEASFEELPFVDVFHFLVQSHALLGRPSRRTLVRGIRAGTGWVGRAVRAYAEGAGIDRAEVAPRFEAYLRASVGGLVASPPEPGELGARRRLLEAVAR